MGRGMMVIAWGCLVAWLPSVSLGQVSKSVRVVTLKNGLQYEGEIARVQDYNIALAAVDPDQQALIVLVDDGLRRIFFNADQIGPKIVEAERNETEFSIFQRALPSETSGAGNLVNVGPFNEFGHRTLVVRNAENEIESFIQGITLITPRYCEVRTLPSEAATREWTMRIATSAIDPGVIRHLLRLQITNPDSPTEYLAIVEFYVQSRQYQRALEELELIRQKTPELKKQLEPIRLRILAEYGRQILNEARARNDAGQTSVAVAMAQALNKEEMPEELQVELAQFQADADAAQRQVEAVRTAISRIGTEWTAQKQPDAETLAIVREFLSELETELRPSNADRLASFLRLADDVEMDFEQKLATAISSWLLGSNSAFDNFAVALSLWPTRKGVREYLTTEDLVRRAAILGELEQLEGADPKFIAPMLAQLTPINPPDLSAYTGREPLVLPIRIPGTKADGQAEQVVAVHVQLPPQYDPYRRYPCILSLPGARTPEEQLVFWTGDYNPVLEMRQGHAARNGFIVASVDWKAEGQGPYGFSAREHLIVLRAVRELLRRLAVDSDRVFLSGHYEGARAAYDIAISHPDQFAGVIGISGGMGKYIDRYKDNRHLGMPVYAVYGARDQFRVSAIDALNLWLRSKAFNECTLVEYQGRLAEDYFEEVPEIMNWCRVHRRNWPQANLDFELECKSLRPWDNFFWFWELRGMPRENIKFPEEWVERGLDPLKITASLRANQPNSIRVGPSNAGSGGVLWLYPQLVDFEKEIRVGDRGEFKGFVRPSRQTMLEDVRTRGDRQHPFWAKLICEGKKWRVGE